MIRVQPTVRLLLKRQRRGLGQNKGDAMVQAWRAAAVREAEGKQERYEERQKQREKNGGGEE